jgi:hypothetical protein
MAFAINRKVSAMLRGIQTFVCSVYSLGAALKKTTCHNAIFFYVYSVDGVAALDWNYMQDLNINDREAGIMEVSYGNGGYDTASLETLIADSTWFCEHFSACLANNLLLFGHFSLIQVRESIRLLEFSQIGEWVQKLVYQLQ